MGHMGMEFSKHYSYSVHLIQPNFMTNIMVMGNTGYYIYCWRSTKYCNIYDTDKVNEEILRCEVSKQQLMVEHLGR